MKRGDSCLLIGAQLVQHVRNGGSGDCSQHRDGVITDAATGEVVDSRIAQARLKRGAVRGAGGVVSGKHGYGVDSDCICGRNFATVRGLREHLTKARTAEQGLAPHSTDRRHPPRGQAVPRG